MRSLTIAVLAAGTTLASGCSPRGSTEERRPAKQSDHGEPPTGDAAATAGQMRISVRAPSVGAKQTIEIRTTQEVEGPGPAGRIAITITAIEKRHEEVLTIDGDAKAKVRVHYETEAGTESRDGRTSEYESPLSGNTYVIWADDGRIAATDADGEEVGPDELDAIDSDYAGQLGEIEAVVAIVAARAWDPDESAELTSDDLLRLTGGTAAKRGTVRLRGRDGDLASFVVDIVAVRENGGDRTETNLTRTVEIDASSGRLITVTSTARFSGTDGMEGTLEMIETRTYE